MLGEVSDNELQGRLKELLGDGGRTESRIVAHLAEGSSKPLAKGENGPKVSGHVTNDEGLQLGSHV